MKTQLIQTDNGFIVVDLGAEIKVGDKIYLFEGKTPSTKEGEIANCYFPNAIDFGCIWYKVIASTYDIHPSIPRITNSVEEIEAMYRDKEIEDLCHKYISSIHYLRYTSDNIQLFTEGHKSNKAEYTREQVIEVIKKGRMIVKNPILKTEYGIADSFFIPIEDVLQSLKPKLEPCMCEITTIETNHEGKIYTSGIKITKLI